MKIVVIGGGWSGCAAALSASKMGAEVMLIERTDMLLGTGLVGGIMRNNGRFTAAEEMIAMGGGELFELTDQNSLHREIEFPGPPPFQPLQRGAYGAHGAETFSCRRLSRSTVRSG